ncbi:hypothetical protein GCM10027280_31510 [Micromonospora polyrhachis]|uniref:EVE domain-containing protein n=1 Tax=Micromonospora polyrhachis TaxID=1282883 RepID=A0A7W7SUK3_9ACTN|nr:hypothetical protein [Micromonospora polyrhachis]MBB4961178.1 hypothetical protein [Micromonospora polyrhachis]
MSRSYLLILGDRDAIGWVLREQRMAFPATPRAEVAALAVDDRLFLYATRGAWRNPTRDRGRIIGTATVRTAVQTLDEPVEIGGRAFVSGCDLAIDGLVPYPGGLELAPLVERLSVFPKPQAWSVYLRRALLSLPAADAVLLDQQVRPLLTARAAALPSYRWAASPDPSLSPDPVPA